MTKKIIITQSPEALPDETKFTLEEAAAHFGITYSGFARLVRLHEERIKDHLTKGYRPDSKWPKIQIDKQGMIILLAVKNVKRIGVDVQNNSNQQIEAKQQMAQTTIALATAPKVSTLSPQLQLAHQLLELADQHERDIATIKEKQQDQGVALEKMKEELYGDGFLNSSQRSVITDRARNYAINVYGRTNPFAFSKTFSALHQHVGRRNIEEYTSADYLPAIQYLKALYGSQGLSWL